MLRRSGPSSSRPSSRRGSGGVAALTLVLLLGACTAKDGSPGPTTDPGSPEQVAAALAAGLAKRDVSAVPFAGATGADVNNELNAQLAGMGSLRPAVTVGPVDTSGSQARATLHYVWSFPGVPTHWSYDSTGTLTKDNGSWRVSWSPSTVEPGLNGSNRLSERRDTPARGEILGADGDAIVTARPVVRIGIDKTRVSAAKTAAAAIRLAKLVHISAAAYAKRVAGAGAADFVEAIVLRQDAADRPTNRAVYAIPGAVPLPGDAMLAPDRDFARPILGTVGPASKELVDASAGTVAAGDQVGRSGLQRRYDVLLRGTPGVVIRLVPKPSDPSASPSSAGTTGSSQPSGGAEPTGSSAPAPSPSAAVPQTLFESKPVAGRALSLTLSVSLQKLAEKTLVRTQPAAALVAVQPSTGRILAAASGPGSKDLSVATVGRYAPGSTFKVVSSLALLRAGLTPSSKVTCPTTVAVNGKKFKNYGDYPADQHGTITLRTALAQSCNTAFIGQRGKLAGNDLAAAAGSLGVGVDYDVGYPSYFGSVPPDSSATGRAAAMIGQGQVLASPMAMAAVAASVSAGRTVIPTLVVRPAPPSKAKPLAAGEAAKLRDMMGAVVSSGSGKVLRSVSGPTVIAKTGTAEFGPRAPFQTHAWMIAAQGDLAVAVFVDIGASGSHTAGPLLARFLSSAR